MSYSLPQRAQSAVKKSMNPKTYLPSGVTVIGNNGYLTNSLSTNKSLNASMTITSKKKKKPSKPYYT